MATEDINNEEEENDFFDYAGDVLAAPFRGVEGAIQGAYNLADYLAFDVLPDYDTRFLGTSKTMAGMPIEGITQFVTGFVPLFGLASRAGALAKAGTVAQRAVAGVATDFTVFNGQEARLSNLIQQVPELQNPVTEFLAYDGDESELEGRMKNVLEGLALGAVFEPFIAGLKAIKNGRKAKDGGADAVGQAQAVVDTGIEQDLASIKADPELDRFFYSERGKYSDVLGLKQERDIIKMDFPVSVFGEDMNIRELEKRLDEAIAKEDFTGSKYSADSLQFYLDNANKKIKKRMDKYVEEEGVDLKAVGLEGVDLSRVDFKPKLKELDFKSLEDIAEPGVSRRSGIFASRIDEKTKDFLIKGTQAVESGKPFQTGGTIIDPSMPQAATVGKTLDQLAVNADTPKVQNLAKNLKKIIKDKDDLDVVVNYKPDVKGDPTTVRGDVSDKGSIAGVYKPSTDRVELYGSADEQTLVHEMLHGVTAKKINAWVSQGGSDRQLVLSNIDNVIKNKAAPKPIRELAKSFKLAAEKVGKEYEFKGTDVFDPKEGKGLYAFKDLDEFLVAAFTDLELQRILRRIPADDQRNIFQKIVDAVAELIGTIRGKEGSNLLDKVLRDSAQIISASRDSYMGKAKLVADEGLASVKQERPDFKKGATDEVLQAIPRKFRGYADELLKGGTPRLPQFALETGEDVVVLKELLEKYYKDNPDKVTVEGAITEVDVDIEQQIMLQQGKDAATKIAEARVVQQSLRDQARGVIENLTDAVDEYGKAGGGSAAIAKLKNNFQQLLNVADIYRQIGRETGQTLQARRENFSTRKIGLSQSDIEIEGLRNQFINASGGMHPDKLVKLIKETIDKDNPDSMIASMFKIAKKAQGKHFLDMPTEYWMNAILSGPKTQMVNIMGNGLTQAMSTLEAVVGGIASGNLSVVKAVMASWADGRMIAEAASFSKKAFKQNDNLLDPQARSFSDRPQGAITGERMASSPLGGMVTERGLTSKKAFDAFGNFIRIPSRLLLTSDEFFKQLAYRRAARLKAAMSGIQQGIKDPKRLAEHIHNTLEGVITEGGRMGSEEGLAREAAELATKRNLKGVDKDKFILRYVKENFDQNKSSLIQYAQDEAQYLTFTRELQEGTLGKVLQEATNKLPMLRLVLPFVRTPTNILKYAFERTPGIFVLKEERQRLFADIKSGDPIRRSQAVGKMMTCIAVSGVFLDTIFNNREYITGGGPKDPKKKEALMATGWRPYSIKIGDTYYSYQRLDPLATLLGVGADLVEVGLREPKAFDESGIERTFLALTLSITRNATNKSYLAGIQNFTDALSDPDRYMAKFGQNFTSSFVPNIVSQMADYDTQALREVRSVGDAFARKLGVRSGLDKKRNLLGEEYLAEQWMGTGFINPIAMSPIKDDTVLSEMASLNHAFRQPPPNLGGQIDMLAHENDSGQTAYDRQLELLQTVKVQGETLRKALTRLVKSRNYQSLTPVSEPGLESPRVTKINNLLTKYRKEAKRQMLSEFPELAEQYTKLTAARAGLKEGMQREDVLALLTQ